MAAATGALALKIGDAFYGYGEHAKAIALYRAALTKGGVDANLVNTRLAMALLASGDRAGAEAAFKALTGPRAESRRLLARLAGAQRRLSLILPIADGEGDHREAGWRGSWQKPRQLPLHHASPGPPPHASRGEDERIPSHIATAAQFRPFRSPGARVNDWRGRHSAPFTKGWPLAFRRHDRDGAEAERGAAGRARRQVAPARRPASPRAASAGDARGRGARLAEGEPAAGSGRGAARGRPGPRRPPGQPGRARLLRRGPAAGRRAFARRRPARRRRMARPPARARAGRRAACFATAATCRRTWPMLSPASAPAISR